MKQLCILSLSAAFLGGFFVPAQAQFFPGYNQPVSYPSNITSGHVIPFLDSDAQFGNPWSQYPLGVVSQNSLIVGKSGSTIGSSANGQTFKIVFTSAGLAGSPITKTYTAGGAETTTTIAAGLCALVNADAVLHNAQGQPIFCQSLGAGVFNLQYTAPFAANGATPLTTATTGSTGTINLTAELNVLDFVLMQLGRAIPLARPGQNGDNIYALDFTGQDSSGVFNTHYGQITVTAPVATAGATKGLINLNTPNGTGFPVGRLGIELGAFLYDSAGALPTGGDIGAGVFNVPTVGGYYIGGNAVALNGALYGVNVFGGTAAGSTLNLQSTQSGSPSGDLVQITAGGIVGYKWDGVRSAIKGTNTNDNAAATNVGEFIFSEVLIGSEVTLTNGVAANVTSISLTAGDWEVMGNVSYDPGGTTTWNSAAAWTSTTTAAFPTRPNKGALTEIAAPMTTGTIQTVTVGAQRMSLSGTTTVFLSTLAGFGTSTLKAYGFLRARRVR